MLARLDSWVPKRVDGALGMTFEEAAKMASFPLSSLSTCYVIKEFMDGTREITVGVRGNDCRRYACTGLSKHTGPTLVDLHSFNHISIFICMNEIRRVIVMNALRRMRLNGGGLDW